MPKGQFSKVPWPGNSWMPFTFQPALCSSASEAPQTFTLTPASYSHWTSTSLHSICFFKARELFHFLGCPSGASATNISLNSVCSMSSFVCQADFFKVPCGHIKAPKWHLKGPLATSKWHTLLLLPWENVNRSTTLIISTWVMSINYSWEKLCNFANLKIPTLRLTIWNILCGWLLPPTLLCQFPHHPLPHLFCPAPSPPQTEQYHPQD